jgi:thiol-disulfide isomerase/thioredoxin
VESFRSAGRPTGIPLVDRGEAADNPPMPKSRTPLARALAHAWVLLLLPAALAIGWGIGQLPTPQPTAEALAPRPDQATATTVASPGEPTAVRTPTQRRPRASAPGTRDAAPPASPPRVLRPGSEFSQWTSFEDAMAESQRNGKPVMIDFNADWCPPCRRMKKEVFQDGAHAAAVQNAVIPVSIVDRAREDGQNPAAIEDLQRRYQVDAFPTLVVFSPATGREVRTKGYGDAEATVAWIIEAARSVR